jgi:hypothetical protein
MKFSQEMELELFGHMLQDEEYLFSYYKLLTDYQASSFAMEWVRQELVSWCSLYKGVPPIDYWNTKAENELGGEQKENVLSVVKGLSERKSKFAEFAKDQFIDFLSSTHIEKAYQEGKLLFQRTMDVSLFSAKVKHGLLEAERIKYGTGTDNVFDWLEQRPKRESQRGIISDGLRLGIPKLDEQFVFRRGTLTAFLGAYKRYKSIMLNHCGFAAMLQGYNVLHVSYENTLQQVGDRYDSRFTGVDYKRMTRALVSEEELKVIDVVFEKLESLPNRLKIQLCKPYRDAINVINSAVEKTIEMESWALDILIVDYVNLCASEKRIDDDYKRIELACWDMQSMAKERDITVITACQAKLGAEEQDSLKGGDTAGSVGILRAADNQIAINQTSDEYKKGIIRLSPLLFRDDEIVTRDIPLNHELTRMCVSRESDALWKEMEDEKIGERQPK